MDIAMYGDVLLVWFKKKELLVKIGMLGSNFDFYSPIQISITIR